MFALTHWISSVSFPVTLAICNSTCYTSFGSSRLLPKRKGREERLEFKKKREGITLLPFPWFLDPISIKISPRLGHLAFPSLIFYPSAPLGADAQKFQKSLDFPDFSLIFGDDSGKITVWKPLSFRSPGRSWRTITSKSPRRQCKCWVLFKGDFSRVSLHPGPEGKKGIRLF